MVWWARNRNPTKEGWPYKEKKATKKVPSAQSPGSPVPLKSPSQSRGSSSSICLDVLGVSTVLVVAGSGLLVLYRSGGASLQPLGHVRGLLYIPYVQYLPRYVIIIKSMDTL